MPQRGYLFVEKEIELICAPEGLPITGDTLFFIIVSAFHPNNRIKYRILLTIPQQLSVFC